MNVEKGLVTSKIRIKKRPFSEAGLNSTNKIDPKLSDLYKECYFKKFSIITSVQTHIR